MNSMSRYYLPTEDWTSPASMIAVGEALSLTGDEAHHCARVLRGKSGDKVEVFDGAGGVAECELLHVSKSEVNMKVLSSVQLQRRAHQVELCQAVPKGSNMEWIVQKSVELGVARIQPLITENTVARAEQLEKKVQKWQRVALEACKQCGQNFLPEVLPVKTTREWLNDREKFEVEIAAALDPRSKPIAEVCQGKLGEVESIRLVTGPEGDFSAEEYDAFYDEGMWFCSIGDIVLKVETATMFCLSVIGYELSHSEL